MSVLVLLEQRGEVKHCALEAAFKAGEIARSAGVDLDAVFIGKALGDQAEQLRGLGIRKVYAYEDEKLSHYSSDGYVPIVRDLVNELGATVKGRYKRHWIGAGDVAASGMPEAYYDLYQDPHEKNPQLIPLIHTQGQFNRMVARHQLFKRKYPDKSNAKGIPYTGLSNARPETKEIGERVKAYMEKMPFDIEEYLEHEIPGSDNVGDWGD